MKLNRQQEILAEIARLHDDWVAGLENVVEMNWDDSDPHDKETGETDYNIHYVDRSASYDQEKEFQDQIAPLLAELEALAKTEFSETPADSVPQVGEASPTVDFDLAVNGDIVLMLVKSDFEDGMVSYRQNGDWVMVQPHEEIPALDDSDLVSVTGEATPIWDQAEGGELTLDDFRTVLLDLRD